MAFSGARRALLTPPRTLLGRERSGFAVDFANDNVLIRDPATSSNNFRGTVQQAIDAGVFSFTRATAAGRFNSSGLYESVGSGVWRRHYDPLTMKPLGFLSEGLRTNIARWCRDFTNAAWTKSNMTTAKTATGIDGVANSASTLTATAGNATALQAITSGSSARITSMWVKRRTGTGAVNITHDNGTTWTAVTVTDRWTQVSNPSTTAANPTVGVRIVTSGDAIDVDFFQHETGFPASSPIATTSAAVSRNGDVLTMALSKIPFSTSEGTFFTRITTAASSSAYDLSIDDGSAVNQMAVRTSGGGGRQCVVISASSLVANLSAGSSVAGNFNKDCVAWKLDDFHGAYEGGEYTADTAGAVPTGLATVRFGHNVGGAAQITAPIASVVLLPRALSQAECDLRVTA